MKALEWVRDNINFISILVGLGFVIGGKAELGHILINQGATL